MSTLSPRAHKNKFINKRSSVPQRAKGCRHRRRVKSRSRPARITLPNVQYTLALYTSYPQPPKPLSLSEKQTIARRRVRAPKVDSRFIDPVLASAFAHALRLDSGKWALNSRLHSRACIFGGLILTHSLSLSLQRRRHEGKAEGRKEKAQPRVRAALICGASRAPSRDQPPR